MKKTIDDFRLEDDVRWTAVGETLLGNGEDVGFLDTPALAAAVAADLDRAEPMRRLILSVMSAYERHEMVTARIDAELAGLGERMQEASKVALGDALSRQRDDYRAVIEMVTRELDRARKLAAKNARRAAYWKGIVTHMKRRDGKIALAADVVKGGAA